MYELEDYINYPQECLVNSKIPKNEIYTQAQLKTRDKNIFTKKIDKIIWLYSLKPDNIRIKPYTDELKEYSEIEIIEILMKKPEETDRIADIIQRFIPYPTFIIFKYNEQLKLCVAHQREHKSDKEKITLTDLQITNWINLLEPDQFDTKLFENLKLEKLNQTNLYQTYSSIFNNIINYNTSKEVQKEIKIPAKEVKIINDQIYEINKKINHKKQELKKETQFNKQMDINIELHQLKQEKNQLKQKLLED